MILWPFSFLNPFLFLVLCESSLSISVSTGSERGEERLGQIWVSLMSVVDCDGPENNLSTRELKGVGTGFYVAPGLLSLSSHSMRTPAGVMPPAHFSFLSPVLYYSQIAGRGFASYGVVGIAYIPNKTCGTHG
jgi:hypothetical protein